MKTELESVQSQLESIAIQVKSVFQRQDCVADNLTDLSEPWMQFMPWTPESISTAILDFILNGHPILSLVYKTSLQFSCTIATLEYQCKSN